MDTKHLKYVTDLKNGDRRAFELIYRIYWAKVYNFASLYLTVKEDIEEVVQDVFIKLWEKRKLISCSKNFEGYLFIITRNTLFNSQRDRHTELFLRYTVFESIEKGYSHIEDEVEGAELTRIVNELLNELPPRQKEVFLLSRKEHLTYKEISDRLKISVKTVENHIGKTLNFFKNNLPMYLLFMLIP